MSDMTLQERRAQILKVYGETERFICEAERKKITQISRTTWWRMRQSGVQLPPQAIGKGKARWLLSELLLWVKDNSDDTRLY